MTLLLRITATLALLVALSVAPRAAAPASPATVVAEDARPPSPVFGRLPEDALWKAYKARFVTAQGRVVDSGNGGISHSEGQGYGLLLALAARDQAAFRQIWGWTRANLMVRGDHLLAWRWEPDRRPAVADLNDAADGDLLVAWALAEASEAWSSPAYALAAREIALDVGRKLVLGHAAQGALLLPGFAGFSAEDRRDGPVVNLSYWVFPALERLDRVAPEIDWAGLRRSGLALAESLRTGPAGLPPDWTSWRDGVPQPADGLSSTFGYDAIRIPLYLAWTNADARLLAPYAALASGDGPAQPDTASGRRLEPLRGTGYAAVASLASCAAGTGNRGVAVGLDLTGPYFPATLALLSLVAAHARTPSCVAS